MITQERIETLWIALGPAWETDDHYGPDAPIPFALAIAIAREARREAMEGALDAIFRVANKYHARTDASSENIADECYEAVRRALIPLEPAP